MEMPMTENLETLVYLKRLIQKVGQNVPKVVLHMLHFPVNIQLHEYIGEVLKGICLIFKC